MRIMLGLLLCAAIAVSPLAGFAQSVQASSLPERVTGDRFLVAPSRDTTDAAPFADALEVVETVRAGEPFFTDDFSQDDGAWRTAAGEDAAFFFEDEAYHIHILAPDTIELSSAGVRASDFYLEVEATQLAGAPTTWYGLYFRGQADDRGYFYFINGDGAYQLIWADEDDLEALIEETLSSALETGFGVTNRLGVLAQGSTLTLLANDAVLAEFEHVADAEGEIGLIAGTLDDGDMEVVFDNLALWEVGAVSEPEAEPTPAPAAEAHETAAAGLPVDASFSVRAALDAMRGEEPLFEESFARDRGQWPAGVEGDVERSYVDRRYRIAFAGADQTVLTPAGIDAADFLVEAVVAQTPSEPGGAAGLAFRYADDDNHYAFLVNESGEYALQKRVGGAPDPMIDWRQSDLIEQGADAENLLGVIVHGSKILLLANEQLLAFVVDDSLDQGDVALAAAEGAVAAFDDLAVWDAGPAADLLAALDEREAAAEPEPAAEAEPAPEPAQDEPPAFDVAMLDTVYAQEPILSENFTGDRGAWATEGSDAADRFYADRAYHLRMTAPNSVSWTRAQTSLADFLVEVETTHAAGPLDGEAGLLFRFQDEDNFYRFTITGEGVYALAKKVAGQWEFVLGPAVSEALEAGEGASNRIGVLGRGPHFVLLANGEALATGADGSFAEGDLALAAGTYEEAGVDIAFDDLEIWDLAPLAGALPEWGAAPARETTTAALTPAMLGMIRQEEPVFSESFTRDRGEWTTAATDEEAYFYANRAYHIRESAPNRLIWSDAHTDSADFLLEADIAAVAGSPETRIGFLFRHADDDNAYLFTITDDGHYLLEKKVDGAWETVVGPAASDAIEMGAGATNRIGVFANGPLIALIANDSVLDAVHDADLSGGSAGLALQTGPDGDGEAAFDDVEFWDLAPLADRLPAGAGAPDSGLAAAPPGVETTETNEHSLAPAHVTEIRSRAPTYTIDLAEDEGRVDVDSNDRVSRGFVDGAFHLATLAPDTQGYAGSDVAAADFYLEVDVEVAEADTATEYGVMFRCEGPGDCYAYQIDSLGNYRLYEYSAGIPLSLLDLTLPNSDAIDGEEGAVNRLGLLVQGSEFTLLVNDTVLAEARDDTYRDGEIGFVVESPTWADEGGEVAYRNLRVWELDSSLATATPETLDAAAILSAIDGIRNGNPTYVVDLAQDEGVVAVGESDYGDSFFEEGAYHIAVWEPAAYGESGTGIWATDFYAEVDTELVQDDLGWSSHGLMFRWTGAWDGDWESGAGYRYAIDGLGYAQLGTGYFDDATDWIETGAINTGIGGANRLGLLAQGSTLVMLVNDEVVAQVADEAYTEGEFGLFVDLDWLAEDSVEVAFSNLRVWDLVPQEDVPAATTDVPVPIAPTATPAGGGGFSLEDVVITADAYDACYATLAYPHVERRVVEEAGGARSGDAIVAEVAKIGLDPCLEFTALFYDDAGAPVGEPSPVFFDPKPVFPGDMVEAFVFLPEGAEQVAYIAID